MGSAGTHRRLLRTNAQSRVLEDALAARRIPYVIVGGGALLRAQEIRDTLAWLRLTINPADDVPSAAPWAGAAAGRRATSLARLDELALDETRPLLALAATPPPRHPPARRVPRARGPRATVARRRASAASCRRPPSSTSCCRLRL